MIERTTRGQPELLVKRNAMRLSLGFALLLIGAAAAGQETATVPAAKNGGAAGNGSASGKPKRVVDYWDAAYLQGARAGYVHTYVEEVQSPKDATGGKQPASSGGSTPDTALLRAATELRLNVLRFGEAVQLAVDAGTYEKPDGKVVGTFLKHFLGTAKTLEITGVVDGNLLQLTLDRSKRLKPAPWSPEVVGLARAQRLYVERAVKPGTEFAYLAFEPSINLVIKTTVRVKEFEEVELFGGKQKKRLLRVESQPEKIQNVQLPTLVSWLGEDFQPLRAEVEIPPFGRVTFYRTTKADALSPISVKSGVAGAATDIGTSQYVKLAKRIVNPYETTAALYRITIRGEDDPGSVFARDERQQVKRIAGKTIDLQVRATGNLPGTGQAETRQELSEYTQSSYFITCDDSQVKKLARLAVGSENDPWKKALRIEKWINQNMKVTSDEALAPASQVARTLRGDCTEFAMLAAAMCRAEGVPSRTAVGLIYADVRTGPVFAFHMWTEVWAGSPAPFSPAARARGEGAATRGGRWLPLDGTLGKGYVGATHLKISDQSWHEVHDQSPLLSVFRVLGKLSIEVLNVERR
jgi:transglutaminase-like putative cysteine protease